MKWVISSFSVFLLLGVLAGCGGGSSTSNSGNNGAPAPVAPAGATQEFLYVSDTIGELFGFSIDANSGALSAIRSGHPMDVVGTGFAGEVRIVADPTAMISTSAGRRLMAGPT